MFDPGVSSASSGISSRSSSTGSIKALVAHVKRKVADFFKLPFHIQRTSELKFQSNISLIELTTFFEIFRLLITTASSMAGLALRSSVNAAMLRPFKRNSAIEAET